MLQKLCDFINGIQIHVWAIALCALAVTLMIWGYADAGNKLLIGSFAILQIPNNDKK